MVCEYVLSTGLSKPDGYYSLEQTHIRYIGENPYGEQLNFFRPYTPKSVRSSEFKGQFNREQVFYGAEDSISVLRVYYKQLALIEELKMKKVMALENEFVLVLADMELNGMPIDVDRWIELADWIDEELEKVLSDLNTQLTVENWNSAKQVVAAFKALGIKVDTRDAKTGKNKESVNETIIKEQADKFPIINTYLRYKGLQKIKSSYGLKFLRYVSPIDNRVHTNYFQILVTGRTSSNSPNLQNIIGPSAEFPEGAEWRKAFKAEKGRKLILADFDKQEIFIAANKSKDPVMLEALRNGEDIHKTITAALYNIPVEEVTPYQRKNGKIAGFLMLYKGGPSKLSKQFAVPLSRGKAMQNGYYYRFKKIKEMQDKSFAFALENGYIKTDTLGRRTYINIERIRELSRLSNIDERFKKDLDYELVELGKMSANYIIQGEGASMSKLAGIYLRREFKNTNNKILLLEHDAYLVESDSKTAEETKLIVESCMQKASDMLLKEVSTKAEGVISQYWDK